MQIPQSLSSSPFRNYSKVFFSVGNLMYTMVKTVFWSIDLCCSHHSCGLPLLITAYTIYMSYHVWLLTCHPSSMGACHVWLLTCHPPSMGACHVWLSTCHLSSIGACHVWLLTCHSSSMGACHVWLLTPQHMVCPVAGKFFPLLCMYVCTYVCMSIHTQNIRSVCDEYSLVISSTNHWGLEYSLYADPPQAYPWRPAAHSPDWGPTPFCLQDARPFHSSAQSGGSTSHSRGGWGLLPWLSHICTHVRKGESITHSAMRRGLTQSVLSSYVSTDPTHCLLMAWSVPGCAGGQRPQTVVHTQCLL